MHFKFCGAGYMYTHVYVYIYIFIYLFIVCYYVCICVHTSYIFIYTYMYICRHSYIHSCIYTYMHIYMCFTCVCMYACLNNDEYHFEVCLRCMTLELSREYGTAVLMKLLRPLLSPDPCTVLSYHGTLKRAPFQEAEAVEGRFHVTLAECTVRRLGLEGFEELTSKLKNPRSRLRVDVTFRV